MTHDQIAERVFDETGIKVSRSSVSAAFTRAGKTNRVRYEEEIPWNVSNKHNHHYMLAMLRVKARINRGLPVTDEQKQRYESWEAMLKKQRLKVVYDRESEDGFYYLKRGKRT